MGLSVSVGMVADMERIGETEGAERYRRQFAALSTSLEAEGVSGYREPDVVELSMRPHCSSFPYSMLAFLRRCFALQREGQPVTPTDDSDDDRDYVIDATSMLNSHLLCHSDCDGYYVPVDFYEPLFLAESNLTVGSSQRLLAERREVAPHIGVTLEPDETLSDAEAARLNTYEDGQPYWRELVVWLALHEACRVSVTTGAAIVFH